MLKVDKYYDVQCDYCGKNRSSDFEWGLAMSIKELRKLARLEGWTYNKKDEKNICPECIKKHLG